MSDQSLMLWEDIDEVSRKLDNMSRHVERIADRAKKIAIATGAAHIDAQPCENNDCPANWINSGCTSSRYRQCSARLP